MNYLLITAKNDITEHNKLNETVQYFQCFIYEQNGKMGMNQKSEPKLNGTDSYLAKLGENSAVIEENSLEN